MKSKNSLPSSRNPLFVSILSQIQSVPSQKNERKKTISHLFSTINFYFCLTLDFWLPTHSRCRGYCCLWSHSMTHTHTHTSPVNEKSARRRYLYLTTHGTHHIHATGWIRNRSFKNRTAIHKHLKLCGHRDKLIKITTYYNFSNKISASIYYLLFTIVCRESFF